MCWRIGKLANSIGKKKRTYVGLCHGATVLGGAYMLGIEVVKGSMFIKGMGLMFIKGKVQRSVVCVG